MEPEKERENPIRGVAAEGEGCILCWLEIFGYVDMLVGTTAAAHLVSCERCRNSITNAERGLAINVSATHTWLARATVIAKRSGPLKTEARMVLLKTLAIRMTRAEYKKPPAAQGAACSPKKI